MQSGFLEGIYTALEFGAQRMRATVQELTPEQLAAVPKAEGFENSVATLVMHVAAVEINMAHRLMGKELPAELKAEYRLDQPQNPLPKVEGETAESLLAKFDKARAVLREAFEGLTDADLDREWEGPGGRKRKFRELVQMLPQHQGQHYGHIQYVLRLIG